MEGSRAAPLENFLTCQMLVLSFVVIIDHKIMHQVTRFSVCKFRI
jgi:hypothetical protein